MKGGYVKYELEFKATPKFPTSNPVMLVILKS